jgi:hypothetical protein
MQPSAVLPGAEAAFEASQAVSEAGMSDEGAADRLDVVSGDEQETESVAARAETGPATAETVEASGKDRPGPAPEEPEKKKRKRDKPGHRAIPTWDEAIELIVAKNLEARSKSSNDASSRPRPRRKGGRRRGGERTG